jgi:sarcosine oxidase
VVPRDVDIAVVGAGIAGVATAWALSGARESVALLEQFDLGHARGSSHGTSRIWRLNYPDERFVRLAQDAADGWRELEAACGDQLVDHVGAIDIGPNAVRVERALAACGVACERLSRPEVESRWPLRLEDDETALFQRDGGVIHADRAHRALLALAVDGGVDVRARAPVRALTAGPSGVRVTLDDEELTAHSVVVTAGAWARELLSPLGIELQVEATRETVAYLELGADVPPVIDYGRAPEPSGEIVSRHGQASYALPARAIGLKAGIHHSGPVVDPDDGGEVDERIAAWVSRWAASRYDGIGDLVRTETCLYTNTPDEDFVLRRRDRVVIGSACSGHGFKFAPVVGRALAALAREVVD